VTAERDLGRPRSCVTVSSFEGLERATRSPTEATSILFALILVPTVFGWTSGRALLKTAYIEAKQRAAAKANAELARTGAEVSAGG